MSGCYLGCLLHGEGSSPIIRKGGGGSKVTGIDYRLYYSRNDSGVRRSSSFTTKKIDINEG